VQGFWSAVQQRKGQESVLSPAGLHSLERGSLGALRHDHAAHVGSGPIQGLGLGRFGGTENFIGSLAYVGPLLGV